MTDYVVYHKPEVMGYDALSVNTLSIVTNKRTAAPMGARVWLLTGQGQPRKYYLRGTFLIADMEPTSDYESFGTVISGKDGELFHPMPFLSNYPWWKAFLKSQGNFAFGFQPIKDPNALAGLRAIATKHRR